MQDGSRIAGRQSQWKGRRAFSANIQDSSSEMAVELVSLQGSKVPPRAADPIKNGWQYCHLLAGAALCHDARPWRPPTVLRSLADSLPLSQTPLQH